LDADPGDPNHADADVDLQHWKKDIFQDFLMDLGCFLYKSFFFSLKRKSDCFSHK
jgi:hypothetical protein